MSQPKKKMEKSPFQEMLEQDLTETFVNPKEFATRHSIEGREVILVENLTGEKEGDAGARQQQWMMSDADKVIYLADSERKRAGLNPFRAEQRLLYDGAYMTVISAIVEDGLWCVSLLGVLGR